MKHLLKIDLMLEDGLTPRDQRHLEKLVTMTPEALNATQVAHLKARSRYLTADALKHFGIKGGKNETSTASNGGDDLDSKSGLELKALAKKAGLPVGGSKAVLIARLRG